MRLLSATVSNYRIHKDLKVTFDPHRTLIGGLNETGKSTLAEALHRVLFLRAKGNTSEHRAMVSTLHQGHPEVSLSFEGQGIVWQLTKRFGSSGTTTLTATGRPTLTGEAAETELARVLGVGCGLSGKDARGQWAHLWIWQHQSAEDPTEHANQQKDQLLHRLQTMGGAAAMQSAHDTLTAMRVAERHEEIFTSQGKPKASSDLAKAGAAASAALEAEAAAAARVKTMETEAATWLDAGSELTRLARDLVQLRQQLAEAGRQQILIRQQQEEAARQAQADLAAAAALQDLEQRESVLTGMRQELAALETELAPQHAGATVLSTASAEAQSALSAATRSFEQASEAAQQARHHQDLAQAWLAGHDTGAALERLTSRAAAVAAHRVNLAKVNQELAALPAMDTAALARLEKLAAAVQSATASLTAMAAGIEVLAAAGPVSLAGEPLPPGSQRILTDEAELSLGTDYQIRIRPGGGTSLAGAREAQRLAREQFDAALTKGGVVSLEEAAATAARRTGLLARQGVEAASLSSLQAESLPRELEAAGGARTAAMAEVARRAAAFPELVPPASAEEAREVLTAMKAALAVAEREVARTRTLREAAAGHAAKSAAALQQHEASLMERLNRRTGLQAKLDYLIETHGDDAARASALAVAKEHRQTAAAVLAATRKVLDDLQPELNGRTLQRLQQSLEMAAAQQAAAETRRAVAEDKLRSDGSTDPAAELALARARVATAEDHLLRLTRHASAIQLLHQTFAAEQQAMADRFTAPLADRISGYLECIYGPGARAVVQFEKQAFAGLHLHRPQRDSGSLAFEILSGGTREQTAAAVRLAMAEVLAAGHDGTLPVLFDDAFTHSDPARLASLQNMLYLAAERGLQILLLTCNPGDYAGLGARTVTL